MSTLAEIEKAIAKLPTPEQRELYRHLEARFRRGAPAKSRKVDGGAGIEKTKGVCRGDASIARTRIPVWVLEQAWRLGCTEADLLVDYPSITAADLAAAWEYVRAHCREIETAIREKETA